MKYGLKTPKITANFSSMQNVRLLVGCGEECQDDFLYVWA